jgi:pilus assembly protein Flp/PilA
MVPYRFFGAWFDKEVIQPVFAVLRDSSGVTAIEYGLIAALISIAAVTVMSTVGTNLSSVFNTVAGDL